MKTAQNHKIISFFLVSLVLGTVLVVKNVSAQEKLPLVVAPARQEVALDAGKKDSLIIKFFNESNVPVSGNIRAVDFIVQGNEGKPILLENSALPVSSRYSASSWVTLPYDTATIPAGTVLKVQFEVNVPKDALPGGRYVAIYFEQTGFDIGPVVTTRQEGESSVSPRIVGLLNIRVNGPVTEKASVLKFTAPVFSEYGPVMVNTEIYNSGNYHIAPKGTISLFDSLGRKVGKASLEDKNIFPESSRLYETAIGPKLLFGKFKLALSASYGDGGQLLSAVTYAWIFPWRLILAIVLGIAIITLIILTAWRMLKGRQKKLETVLEKEISELEGLKEKYKDKTSNNVQNNQEK